MIIDANSYWFDERIFHDETLCEQFLAEVPRAYDTEGYLTVNSVGKRQIVIEMPAGSPGLNYIEGDYTLEKRLADMDEAGVDKAILKLPGCHEWMSLEMCRRFNDGMAADAKASNGRLIPLVAVPPFGTKANLEELDRRLDDGFAGVQLCAHYGKRYLDDRVFSSFFEHLNERNVTVYVHHVPVPVENESLLAYDNLRRSYGRCVDQTTAIGREIFGDFFERYPNIKMVHSMLGGAYFAFKEMLLPHGPKRLMPLDVFRSIPRPFPSASRTTSISTCPMPSLGARHSSPARLTCWVQTILFLARAIRLNASGSPRVSPAFVPRA